MKKSFARDVSEAIDSSLANFESKRRTQLQNKQTRAMLLMADWHYIISVIAKVSLWQTDTLDLLLVELDKFCVLLDR